MMKKFILVALIAAIALVCLVDARPRRHHRRQQKQQAEVEESDSETCGVECYTNLRYCQDNNRIRRVCGSTNASWSCWDSEKHRCAMELQQCKSKLRCPQWITDDADEEESDFIGFLAPIAFNLIKNKLSKRDEAVEEADAEFLGKALKKVGKVALSVGKMYLRTQGVPLDDEESDAAFWSKLKNWWSTKGEGIFQKGLQIYSAIKGNNAAPAAEAGDDSEEADFINFKNILKKVGSVALQAGKAYVGSKYGIQLDNEEEEADFINFKNLLKKVGGIALQAGKAYVGNKYGIQLDDEDQEESDLFITRVADEADEEEESDKIKFGNFFKKLGKGLLDVGKTYVASKYGVQLDNSAEEAEEESDAEFWGFVGRVAWNVMKPTPAY